MKFLLCTILLIVAISAYADAFGMWKGGCKSDDDCKETQCCLKQYGTAYGQCMKRPQEGEMCIPQNKFNKMFQQNSCPCPEGLECSSGGKAKSPGMNYAVPPVCRPIPETTEEPTTES
ncbi:U3-aranetoxin-Ce1a-like [Argiope bruennichi]|uniref:U3-aranetoxin-Ce1a like protein n=1 Tax=Argiope bruennichi TaxID=94029 RepID=A0A8T0FXQ5_ARGBR|nr:U3-aranetoxin-Ce1a-like [Argiope bruennichi]KAF8794429.1 U3-aranetoxin-Ce1a like protein [Argiope bruennichi]